MPATISSYNSFSGKQRLQAAIVSWRNFSSIHNIIIRKDTQRSPESSGFPEETAFSARDVALSRSQLSLERTYDFRKVFCFVGASLFFISDVMSFHGFPFGYFPLVLDAIRVKKISRTADDFSQEHSVLFGFADCAVVEYEILIAETL